MSRKLSPSDAFALGFLAFAVIFFGLLEERKRQESRMRRLRKIVLDESAEVDSDAENLGNDWKNIGEDLKRAYHKIKTENVQQVT